MVQPDVGIIPNIGESHLEFLETTEGVAREKSGLFAGLKPGGKIFVPANLKHLDIVKNAAAQYSRELVTYGFEHWDCDHQPDLRATLIEKGTHQYTFNFLGKSFTVNLDSPLLLSNLLGAMSVFNEFGVKLEDLQSSVATMDLQTPGRMQRVAVKELNLFDDTYNANPTSFEGAIRSIKEMYPSHELIVVAGKMAELGADGPQIHFELGKSIADMGAAHLLALNDELTEKMVGGWNASSPQKGQLFDTIEEIADNLKAHLTPNSVILVKGSRSAKMERVTQKLVELYA